MADLSRAVMDARAHVAPDSRSVMAFAALDEALNARGELHWSRGDPEAADGFHGCIAANESRIAIAPEDAGGHAALVRSLATIAEWNTQQGDAAWALEYLERAVAASKQVGQLRAAGKPMPLHLRYCGQGRFVLRQARSKVTRLAAFEAMRRSA